MGDLSGGVPLHDAALEDREAAVRVRAWWPCLVPAMQHAARTRAAPLPAASDACSAHGAPACCQRAAPLATPPPTHLSMLPLLIGGVPEVLCKTWQQGRGGSVVGTRCQKGLTNRGVGATCRRRQVSWRHCPQPTHPGPTRQRDGVPVKEGAHLVVDVRQVVPGEKGWGVGGGGGGGGAGRSREAHTRGCPPPSFDPPP